MPVKKSVDYRIGGGKCINDEIRAVLELRMRQKPLKKECSEHVHLLDYSKPLKTPHPSGIDPLSNRFNCPPLSTKGREPSKQVRRGGPFEQTLVIRGRHSASEASKGNQLGR